MRMTTQPITPPMAQMSMVIMLIGMSSARTRFVRKRRTTPRIALMRNTIN